MASLHDRRLLSDYNAFQLKVEKRFNHGLSALLSFTGQKLIDDFAIISNVGNSTGGIQNIYNGQGRAGCFFERPLEAPGHQRHL